MPGISSVIDTDSKKTKTILVLFLLVYHLALFYSLSHQPVLLRDSEEYLYSAASFQTDNTFYAGPQSIEKDYRLYSKRTPFYPLVLYGFNGLHLHLNIVYILQVFLGVFTILLAFYLLKQFIQNSTRAFLFLIIFLLATPSQFIYSQFIMADLYLQLFVMLCLVSFAMYIKTRNFVWLMSLILFSTLAALTKPVFLLASFGIGLFCGYHFIITKGRRLLAFLAIIPIFTWFAISSQNQKLTGVFHYSSIGYINLLHYNTNLYLHQSIGKTQTDKLLEPLMIIPHTKAEFTRNYKEANSVCIKAILSHPGGYTLYHAKGMVYFFLDPGRFDLHNFFRIEEGNSKGFLHKGANEHRLKTMFNNHPIITLSLAFIFLFNIIKSIGFIGFVWVFRKNKLAWAGALIVFYIAFLTGPLGASRFALPVELIIICFASVFYALRLESLKKRVSL